MIVFRKQERTARTLECISAIRSLANRCGSGTATHDDFTELLIEFGELECALVDSLSRDRDTISQAIRFLRRTALLTGQLFYHSWTGKRDAIGPELNLLNRSLSELHKFNFPGEITIRFSEGFIHYGIFPEMYLEAARKFYKSERPERVVSIGIRSIGTCLSALIGAVLQRMGCEVHSCTVRPRGHPFDRFVLFAPALEKELVSLRGAHFLIADEGPGLSGSSFNSVAEQLGRLGLGEPRRLVLFPCWEPNDSDFISQRARETWRRHRKVTVNFEQAWVRSGQLLKSAPYRHRIDISAGNWRPLFFAQNNYPAVHPHHEQRKYLCSEHRINPAAAAHQNKYPLVLAKFAGLGRYGRKKLARCEQLWEAGFGPRPLGLQNGFITTEFIHGRPIWGEKIEKPMLDRFAEYLSFISKNLSAGRNVAYDDLRELIITNVEQGLGKNWAKEFETRDFRAIFESGPAVALDARMFPVEWIRSGDFLFKTDALDHHMDQFFPRRQDIAWDVAGTCIEFQLDAGQREYFVSRFAAMAADKGLPRRLPFFTIAYLAFRLGYSVICAASLGSAPDADRFRSTARFYSSRLRRSLSSIRSQTP